MTRLSLIVAMDQNRLIGKDNALPWHLPADLAHFKRNTLGKPIIMGRKTYESIGRPLPGRRNIVVTRNPNFLAAGCDVVSGIKPALLLCDDEPEAVLIGGASLYELGLPLVSQMYITEIHHEFMGDSWFEEIDFDQWTIKSREEFHADPNNDYAFTVLKYTKEVETPLV